ncbi:DUF1178 family protein [Roseovarius nanhaiticus]|uniref:DUF1178 family protein n=1 Tax=Roseovarius nanhaiticus TaxID=573024 RepID=A0A1N7FN83_9RHOB|nr:DUF1178 family protein [Roseovarius nanhaiticus]SEK49943.1 hypothetical protein SAMN05216208_0925 [Roseovarius nanhaiticus]SIS01819.1 hypothetical protein SAMN05421666_1211 [Roseovarius nanhaiticus]
MIKFSLKCAQGHVFDSWFQSADAYDTLAARGMVACAVCGDTQIAKSIMAPRIGGGHHDDTANSPEAAPRRHALAAPGSEAERAMAALRRKIEANSDYVGTDFASEARRIHEGEAPARSIHGEARPAEARKLIEDGVPILPLPFGPARKVN